MSTENLEHEDQNRTTEPIIDILGNEAPSDPEQEIVSQGVHNYSAAETYVCPTDPAVLQQLEWFRDQKLALMMHFGLYCQPGMVASWALSDKDSDWSRHQVNWTDGETFKKQYFGLNRSFNPVRFQPEEWAQMAEDCGFRYLLLTTKHHDGFCLWDTKYTDYKTTAEDCPFHEHKNADIVKSMFDAFRAKGIGIGAYFSKADWHCPDYWNEDLRKDGLTSRGPSYDPKEYPNVWNRFKEYTKIRFWSSVRITVSWIFSGSTRAGSLRATARILSLERSLRKHVRFSRGFSPLTVQSAALTKTT